MRILAAIEAVDFGKELTRWLSYANRSWRPILFRLLFLFRSRSGTAIKILVYDSQGFWIAQKRLSERPLPVVAGGSRKRPSRSEAHQAQVLLAAGDPSVQGAPVWRPVK